MRKKRITSEHPAEPVKERLKEMITVIEEIMEVITEEVALEVAVVAVVMNYQMQVMVETHLEIQETIEIVEVAEMEMMDITVQIITTIREETFLEEMILTDPVNLTILERVEELKESV